MHVPLDPVVPTSARARRVVCNVLAALSAMSVLAGCSSGGSDTPAASGDEGPTASTGPRTGTVVFAGAEDVRVTVTLLPGWMAREVFVTKSGATPTVGLSFFDVAGIYADGCQWKLVEPRVGPTVDDLVAAYAGVPGSGDTVRDVSVDGFRGKLIEYTVPDYDEAACKGQRFGLFQEDNATDRDGDPHLWAQMPKQRNELRILDVNGERLVINARYAPDVSVQDLEEISSILESVQIS